MHGSAIASVPREGDHPGNGRRGLVSGSFFLNFTLCPQGPGLIGSSGTVTGLFLLLLIRLPALLPGQPLGQDLPSFFFFLHTHTRFLFPHHTHTHERT